MKYIAIFCIVTVLALAGTSHAHEKIELNPEETPFPGLKRGTIDEVVPKPGNERVFSGHYASEGQIPYQAGLLIDFGNDEYAWCGGTLIGREWILTAAHCTAGAKAIEVRLGSIYSDQPQLTLWASENHVHKSWQSKSDDIALLKIKKVDFNANMTAVKLPARNGQHSEYVNSKAIASGWGIINDGGETSNRLKYVEMEVMSRNACGQVYGSLGQRPSILCTKTKGVGSTCSGDSGGPLTLENTQLLIGLVRFGAAIGCTRGYPAGFTRVTHYLDWIHQVSGISS